MKCFICSFIIDQHQKTNVLDQDVPTAMTNYINNEVLEVTSHFTSLGSTITSNPSLDSELNKHIARATAMMAQLSKKVWENSLLIVNTKLLGYQACVLSSLLYGSETWTIYARQKKHLVNFHIQCLHRILGISWQDKIPNISVLEQAGSLSLHPMHCKRRLRWIGHVHRMADARIPKDVIYS